MHCRSNCLTHVLSSLILIVSLTSASAAAQARHFAGSYQLTGITQTKDAVQVTITLDLRNYSGADISNGSVVLYSSGPNPSLLGAFNAISVFHYYQQIVISQTFTIPVGEYALWQQGRDPALRFFRPGTDDALRTDPIDLRRSRPLTLTK
jgi:hypothetical protein